MDRAVLKGLLDEFAAGRLSRAALLKRLETLPFENIGFANVDTHRPLRCGAPEVVYGPGKAPAHLEKIVGTILGRHGNVIVTRLDPDRASALRKKFPSLRYFPEGRILALKKPPVRGRRYVAVVCAGTSDIPVAEEAALTLEILGSRAERLYDVGVAGLHRLLDRLPLLRGAACVVCVAGMEGALPSVVGGLVERPVIAVPTSVGYGMSLGGIAPLLTMLNSCTPNVVTVNVDNGFGAAYAARLIAAPR